MGNRTEFIGLDLYYSQEFVDDLQNNYIEEIKRLNNIINKAREYIEEKYDYILGDDTFLDHDERIDRKQINHIIETLKGSDKE